MSKRLKTCAAVATISLIGIFIWRKTAPSEPVWRNHSVTYWADELGRSGTNRDQAVDAFRGLRASAVPFLVARLSEEPGIWKRQYERAWPRLPDLIRSRLQMPVSDFERKKGAMLALVEIGPEARPAVPALLNILRKAQRASPPGPSAPTAARLMNLDGQAVLVSGSVTNPAIIATVSGTGVRATTLPKLPVFYGLVTQTQETEMNAIRALAAIENGDRDTFGALLDSLRNRSVSDSAVIAIRSILTANRSSRSSLLAALREWRYTPLPNELPPLRRAIDFLDPMVENDAEIQSFLMSLLGNADPKVRAAAVKALRNGNLASPQLFAALCGVVPDPDPNVRTEATDVIVLSERRYQNFWMLLLGAAKDSRVPVRLGTTIILGQFGEPARRALPYTKKMLADTDAGVRARAAIAIGKLGAWGKDAVPELKLASTDTDEEVRKAAVNALALIEPSVPAEGQR